AERFGNELRTMGYATTSLSTSAVPGNSSPLSVNWRGGKPWAALLTISSSAGARGVNVPYCLAHLTSSGLPTSSAVGLPGPTWYPFTGANGAAGLSTSQVSSAGYTAIHVSVPNIDIAGGLMFSGTYPIAGIRIASTALSSCVLSLTLIQGEGW